MVPRRLKIVNVITRLILGGAQEAVLDSTVGLRERGHDVTLVTGPPIGPEGELISQAKERGVEPVIFSELRRSIGPLCDPVAYWKLVRFFKDHAPDIVHTHSSKAGILGRFAARAAGVPIVVHTIRGLPFHPSQNVAVRRLYIACERAAARKTDKIVVVSHAMAVQAARAGIGPVDSFRRIFSGFDVDAFANPDPQLRQAFRRQWGADDRSIVVGKVARLFHLKGHADLIEAFSKACRADERLRLVFVGDGVLADPLRKQCHERGIADRVYFQGLVPPGRMPAVYGALDVLAHCSLREGLARVFPQALAAGTPVVAYNTDGADEVVAEQTGGTLIPPGDMKALTARLIGLIENLEERRSAALRGREFVKKHFGLRTMIKALNKLYLELADAKGL